MPIEHPATPGSCASDSGTATQPRSSRSSSSSSAVRSSAREGGPARFAARVEYDGTDFAGYQMQPGRRTVQGELEAALMRISGGSRMRVDAAGRTDAGGHATGPGVAFPPARRGGGGTRPGPSRGSGSADEAGRSRSTWSATPSCARWSGASWPPSFASDAGRRPRTRSRRPPGRPDGRWQGPSPPPRGYACGGSSSDGPSDRGTEMMTTKTYTPRESEIERRWFVVDATDETLGRLASRIARVLEGKHKPTFATHIDSGDHVIVVNAARIAVSRNKLESKLYIRHSGYPHGLKQETLGELLARRPEA